MWYLTNLCLDVDDYSLYLKPQSPRSCADYLKQQTPSCADYLKPQSPRSCAD